MIVIPMAGLSSRFTERGYMVPKYMLKLSGETVFSHSVASFSRYFCKEKFLFVCRDIHNTYEFLKGEIEALGIAESEIVMIDGISAGQADTVRLGLLGASVQDEPLTIFNIDTFRPNFSYPSAEWLARADGYIEVMYGTDPGYSYVLPDGMSIDRVARTAEKEQISRLASTGLYWFRSSVEFLRSLDVTDSHASGEFYIAPVYNQMIKKGLDIRFNVVGEEEVVMCGTPDQYEYLQGRS